eukprot:jgi/Mesvir1/24866/Mv26014-RA.1
MRLSAPGTDVPGSLLSGDSALQAKARKRRRFGPHGCLSPKAKCLTPYLTPRIITR